jgi:hypothetical protein
MKYHSRTDKPLYIENRLSAIHAYPLSYQNQAIARMDRAPKTDIFQSAEPNEVSLEDTLSHSEVGT